MRLFRAVAIAVICGAPCEAGQAAAPAIIIETSDREATRPFVEGFSRLRSAYPRLFAADALTAISFTENVGAGPTIYYDVKSKTIAINMPRAFYDGGPQAASGYFKDGAWPDAFLFHELLHGLSRAVPGLEERYERDASQGRLQAMWADWAAQLDEAVLTPQFEAIVRLESRDRYAAQDATQEFISLGVKRFKTRAELAAEWDRIAAKMSVEEARRILSESELPRLRRMASLLALPTDGLSLEQLEAALSEADARDHAAYLRAQAVVRAEESERKRPIRERLTRAQKGLARKHRLPRRGDDDVHAGEPSEWFAYGGEVYFYGASPDNYLTPGEMDFWRELTPSLRARRTRRSDR
jgi:DNA-binding transcriptional MerR regulator